ncbi:MAG: hypothetical protein ACFFDK_09645 [Promethearchaeota archaeon]
MKFIIDGDYNRDLISFFEREKLPVTHMIVHVPANPIGNSSIFLPKILPTFEEFEDYTKIIQDYGIVPIAGIDSTCQGNFEAHAKQNDAINSLFKKLSNLGYKDILVSSPNNIGVITAKFPKMKIFLSYSQCVTSLNRGKIFFNLGADYIIIHPDVVRYFPTLRNFIKLKKKEFKFRDVDYILPLNLGCNWGCIHWYQHHNLQSHRTINSPLSYNQEKISDIANAFDYPLLYCWKKRLEDPLNLLKEGWVSPTNIELYENLGFENYLLFSSSFSNEKIIEILHSYIDKTLKTNFNEYLNFPQPYGDYWPGDKIKKSLNLLDPNVITEFCRTFPYENHYPFEKEMNEYCNIYLKNLGDGKIKERDKIIELITKRMHTIEKGVLEE